MPAPSNPFGWQITGAVVAATVVGLGFVVAGEELDGARDRVVAAGRQPIAEAEPLVVGAAPTRDPRRLGGRPTEGEPRRVTDANAPVTPRRPSSDGSVAVAPAAPRGEPAAADPGPSEPAPGPSPARDADDDADGRDLDDRDDDGHEDDDRADDDRADDGREEETSTEKRDRKNDRRQKDDEPREGDDDQDEGEDDRDDSDD